MTYSNILLLFLCWKKIRKARQFLKLYGKNKNKKESEILVKKWNIWKHLQSACNWIDPLQRKKLSLLSHFLMRCEQWELWHRKVCLVARDKLRLRREKVCSVLPGGPRLPCLGTLYQQVGKGVFRCLSIRKSEQTQLNVEINKTFQLFSDRCRTYVLIATWKLPSPSSFSLSPRKRFQPVPPLLALNSTSSSPAASPTK